MEKEAEPETQVVDTTADSSVEVAVIDDNCFLCVALPTDPPEGIEAKVFHYCHGFADGVSTAIRGQGPHFCKTHRALVRKALLDRGVNWDPEPRIVT